MKTLINVLKGMAIGVSNIIPGVSGGTMAVVLGLYDKLISSINNIFKDFKNNFIFLLQIGIGAGLGILLFSKLLSYLLNTYSNQTNFFFIGLILGSCPLLFNKAREKKSRPVDYICFVIGFGILALMAIFKDVEGTSAIIRELSGSVFLQLTLAGIVAAAAMILPGLSGSFILLLMGLYNTIVTAVSELNVMLLIPVAIGVIIGIVSMTKVIGWLFEKYTQQTYFFILGLVLASIFSIYPGFAFNMTGVISIVTLIIGFGCAYAIGRNEI